MSTLIRSILATDCGSTTTKAILITQQPGGEYRLTARGEAPTTVEAPFDDVTIGVTNAVREIEELTDRAILDEAGKPRTPELPDGTGVDLYLSTSSAGGGLQMSVAGVVRSMSVESAERAALGAGAIIIDAIAVDDGRKEFQRVERLRQLRPDMILFSGGTDGGTIRHLVEIAELIVSADPQPRLGDSHKLPVIFAGNSEAFPAVKELLENRVSLRQVENIRPSLDKENLKPAREAIHDLFLEHVMQQAPGYAKLTGWTSADIMSTPNAVGEIMQMIAAQRIINLLGVDIGGATTDVFSVFGGQYHRSVSANLGMSYSICNVLAEAKLENIQRWLPFVISDSELRNQLRNKMIRPTTIPQRIRDLQIEQAVCREALRLAFDHHRLLARGLAGGTLEKNVGNIFSQSDSTQSIVKLRELDMLVGSGGVLSHAPLRQQAALMMMDAFQPEGFTLLTVDSIFMMPQLGVLAGVLPEAAAHVFEKDCLIILGECIAPVGIGKDGDPCVHVKMGTIVEDVPIGEIRVYSSGAGESSADSAEIELTPTKAFDLGEGRGKPVTSVVKSGCVGIILDTRGRPMKLPADQSLRIAKLRSWLQAMNIPNPEAE